MVLPSFEKIKKHWFFIFIGFFVAFALMKQCEGEPKTIVETKTVVKWKTDTITQTKIDTIPKTVYIERTKTIKGKDSIIYKEKPTETTITANQYDTEIKSDSATAKLKITTTGELLEVKGVIEYPRIETTTTITKIRDASGFYIYGSMPINGNLSPEIGGMFQIKNKIILAAGVHYNNYTKQADAKVTLAVKL